MSFCCCSLGQLTLHTRPGLSSMPKAANFAGEGKLVSSLWSWQWCLTNRLCRLGAMGLQCNCV